jgi:hypothetical protein
MARAHSNAKNSPRLTLDLHDAALPEAIEVHGGGRVIDVTERKGGAVHPPR